MNSNKKIALSGDRPSGKLHLGHYVGSLKNRILMQDEYDLFIMIADIQALTDNYKNPEKVRENVFQVCLDYLSVGIDPSKVTIFIQSQIPAIPELTEFYLNLVTVARLHRNPTVKDEILNKKLEAHLTAGFLVYPVSQAADITCIGAEIIPVGQDQLPMIEQCNEIVDSFNNIYGPVLTRCKALVPEVGGRLIGIDGKLKMGKSTGNAIFLSDDSDAVKTKVMSMYTDPNHLKVSDPGQIEGNTVFTYLDTFAEDTFEVERLKEHYQRGGLGDVVVKKYLIEVLETFLNPIRAKRLELEKNPKLIWNILKEGSIKTNLISREVLKSARAAMKLNYF